ncbi:EBDP4, emopamil-binding protein [Delitschia confertaspora ATCC 74209]|uniref:EBDP4, emopamil-binding protein n=1 Tax=Delitschia confertaspora ATCC 74209 TaxID=1513339 RepID=A0A9P4JQS8_9PLEO|nr:EBDP4, emopamil-binding protein [Delitschia confertaspora ATCC 74209]
MDFFKRILASSALPSPLEATIQSVEPLPPSHPYYPLDANIFGYEPNERSTLELVSQFGSGCVLILSITYFVTKRVRPHIPVSDLLTTMWFVLCGCMHLFFEGYVVYNFQRVAGMQGLFGEMWKEYALSDSRYLSRDPFVLCVETVTVVFFGPLSFITAGMVATGHPLRYPFQAIVSLGHLYSDTLYYLTSAYGHYYLNESYSRPEPRYFWGYFVGLNAFWIIVPAVLLYKSVFTCGRVFTAMAKIERTLNASRAVEPAPRGPKSR